VGCWAHARRQFVEALKIAQGESSAAEMLALIGMLYDIERELRIKFFREGDQATRRRSSVRGARR